jgi:CubicO group peptidase (beta-lactamase class C family)
MRTPPLEQIDSWPVDHAGVAVVAPTGVVAKRGDTARRLEMASLTKLLTALAVLVAVEEETVSLDDPAGPPGSTVRHLLAHASGLAMDDRTVLAPPATRRAYSNAGFEVLADHVAQRAGMPFAGYLADAVLRPLGMDDTELVGSPASGAVGTVDDLSQLAAELLAPTLLAPETMRRATGPVFPDLAGILPGYGRQDPNEWGLGFEIRGTKAPHWTAPTASPRTFGHFGRAGGFLFVDPDADIAVACLTDRLFGPWAVDAWPPFNQAILDAARA